MDLLKTFPLPGWQIVLGEIFAPLVILSVLQGMLLLLALSLSAAIPSSHEMPFSMRIILACCVAIVAPTLNFLSLLIPNAAVLLFPSWFQTGKDAPQGIEAMGQRLIFMFGQVLVMSVALLPAAALFAVVFIFGKMIFNLGFTIFLASTVAAIVLATEGVIGLRLLGKLFERFDLSAETTN